MKKGIAIKGMSFAEMIADVRTKHEEQEKYIAETGLCPVCKKNPVVTGQVRCQECINETNRLLKELRGTSGFMEMRVSK